MTLSNGLVDALSALHVQVAGFGGTQLEGSVADFLITGGAVDLNDTRLEVIHSSGPTLEAGSTEVNLADYVISNLDSESVLTGLVTINGDLVARAPLL